MKKIIISVLLIYSFQFGFSQPVIEWSQNYGGTSGEIARDLIQTNDGHYIVLGVSGSEDGDLNGNNGERDVWLMKIDTAGSILWSQNYGGSGIDVPSSVIETDESDFIIIGRSESNDNDIPDNYGGTDIMILKVDYLGELIWSKNFGGSGYDAVYSIIKNTNNTYWIVGETDSTDGDIQEVKGARDIWLFQINDDGALIWQKSYGGSDSDFFPSITRTLDGKIMIAGVTLSSDGDVTTNNGGVDLWVVKINNAGEIEWEQNYGGSGTERDAKIVLCDDGYMLFAETYSNDGDVGGADGESAELWAIRLDESGNILWEKTYGGSYNDFINTATSTINGHFVMISHTASMDGDVSNHYGGSWDIWLVVIDETGDIVWEKNYGGSEADFGKSILQTSDGGFIVSGNSSSEDIDLLDQNYGENDVWVFKLSPFTTSTSEPFLIADKFFDVYPNPSTGSITVELKNELDFGKVEVLNPLGIVVVSEQVVDPVFHIDNLPKGAYWVRYSNEGVVGVEKIQIY